MVSRLGLRRRRPDRRRRHRPRAAAGGGARPDRRSGGAPARWRRSTPRSGSAAGRTSGCGPRCGPAARPGPAASIGKVHQGRLNQSLQMLAADLLGADALAWPAADASSAAWTATLPYEVAGMLRSRANTIEGGTTEVNKNVLGEKVLGLPREPDPYHDAAVGLGAALVTRRDGGLARRPARRSSRRDDDLLLADTDARDDPRPRSTPWSPSARAALRRPRRGPRRHRRDRTPRLVRVRGGDVRDLAGRRGAWCRSTSGHRNGSRRSRSRPPARPTSSTPTASPRRRARAGRAPTGAAFVTWTSGTTGTPTPIRHGHAEYLELLDRVLGPLRGARRAIRPRPPSPEPGAGRARAERRASTTCCSASGPARRW